MNSLLIVFVVLIVYLGSILLTINYIKKSVAQNTKEIYSLKKNSIENNIENFSDSYEKENIENIKEIIIEQVNKIYDIDVDSIRNLGAISKSLLTGKNYHKHNGNSPVDVGTLVIPANVIIEGTLHVDTIKPGIEDKLKIDTDLNVTGNAQLNGTLHVVGTATLADRAHFKPFVENKEVTGFMIKNLKETKNLGYNILVRDNGQVALKVDNFKVGYTEPDDLAGYIPAFQIYSWGCQFNDNLKAIKNLTVTGDIDVTKKINTASIDVTDLLTTASIEVTDLLTTKELTLYDPHEGHENYKKVVSAYIDREVHIKGKNVLTY